MKLVNASLLSFLLAPGPQITVAKPINFDTQGTKTICNLPLTRIPIHLSPLHPIPNNIIAHIIETLLRQMSSEGKYEKSVSSD